jgi:hypothetical protein
MIKQNTTMQNIPNEIICKISKSLSIQDLRSLASTCNEYKNLIHKDIKELSTIEKELKKYYIRVEVLHDGWLAYKFYIYNTKKALKWCRKKKDLNTKILDKYINSFTPYVIMKEYEVDLDLRKEIPVKVEKVDFQTFLSIVTSDYIQNLERIDNGEIYNPNGYDQLFSINQYYVKIEEIDECFHNKGIEETLELLKETIKRPKYCTNCTMKTIIKN